MKFKLTIPSKLSEIKLKDYQKYMKIVVENEDAHEFLNRKAVEIFCNIKINDINAIKVSDFNDVLTTLNNTLTQKKKFKQRFKLKTKVEIKPLFIERIFGKKSTFEDRIVEFGFIPKLDDISMGEFVDLQNYLADSKDLHKAMSVMYRPIKYSKKDMYLIEDYEGSEKYSDVMRYAPLDVVLGANVFFYSLGNELLKATIHSLEKEGEMNSQVKQILEENGDGIKAFMHLLEDNHFNLTMSLN